MKTWPDTQIRCIIFNSALRVFCCFLPFRLVSRFYLSLPCHQFTVACTIAAIAVEWMGRMRPVVVDGGVAKNVGMVAGGSPLKPLFGENVRLIDRTWPRIEPPPHTPSARLSVPFDRSHRSWHRNDRVNLLRAVSGRSVNLLYWCCDDSFLRLWVAELSRRCPLGHSKSIEYKYGSSDGAKTVTLNLGRHHPAFLVIIVHSTQCKPSALATLCELPWPWNSYLIH